MYGKHWRFFINQKPTLPDWLFSTHNVVQICLNLFSYLRDSLTEGWSVFGREFNFQSLVAFGLFVIKFGVGKLFWKLVSIIILKDKFVKRRAELWKLLLLLLHIAYKSINSSFEKPEGWYLANNHNSVFCRLLSVAYVYAVLCLQKLLIIIFFSVNVN
jgi:hypothetical protein